MGQGEIELRRLGFPETSTVKVEHNGHVETRTINRSMTLTTVGLGVISMYTGFLWAWEYPDRVDFQVTSQATRMNVSPTENPWMSPRTTTHLNNKNKGFRNIP